MAATPQHAARVLGLDLAASLDDVRRVHRALVRKYHPDMAPDQERATRHMARINAAVDTLTAYVKRAEAARRRKAYDAARRKAAAAARAQPKSDAPRQAEPAKAAPRNVAAGHTVPTAARPEVCGAEQASIRNAARSYAKVLRDIGRGPDDTHVDVWALKMQAG